MGRWQQFFGGQKSWILMKENKDKKKKWKA